MRYHDIIFNKELMIEDNNKIILDGLNKTFREAVYKKDDE